MVEDGCLGWIAESGTSGLREGGWWDPEGDCYIYTTRDEEGEKLKKVDSQLQIARACL